MGSATKDMSDLGNLLGLEPLEDQRIYYLYNILNATEGINGRIRDEAASLNRLANTSNRDVVGLLERLKIVPGSEKINVDQNYVIDVSTIPKIDEHVLQTDILMQYIENPLISAAIVGEKSLEDTLFSLQQKFNGIKGKLPQRYDQNHEEQRQHLIDLIQVHPQYLRINKMKDLNYAGIVYLIATAFLESVLLTVKCGTMAENDNSHEFMNHMIVYGAPAILSFFGSISLYLDKQNNAKDNHFSQLGKGGAHKSAIEEARYIDRVIEQNRGKIMDRLKQSSFNNPDWVGAKSYLASGVSDTSPPLQNISAVF